jgi:hypothetical protein
MQCDLAYKQWELIKDYFDFGYKEGKSKHPKRVLVETTLN